MNLSEYQRPQSAHRLRARSLDPPRFKRRAKSEYPVGYLAQLARPFTSRRAGAGRRPDAGASAPSVGSPAR